MGANEGYIGVNKAYIGVNQGYIVVILGYTGVILGYIGYIVGLESVLDCNAWQLVSRHMDWDKQRKKRPLHHPGCTRPACSPR